MKQILLALLLCTAFVLRAQAPCDNATLLTCGSSDGLTLMTNGNPVNDVAGCNGALFNGTSYAIFELAPQTAAYQYLYFYDSLFNDNLAVFIKSTAEGCDGDDWECVPNYYSGVDFSSLGLDPTQSYYVAILSAAPNNSLYYFFSSQGEICDGLDNDCDNLIDEEGSAIAYYQDADGDGYGSGYYPSYACTPETGYVDNYDDCDDTNAAINSAGIETCDGTDENCDGTLDNGFDLTTFYYDADQDGFGGSYYTIEACAQPAFTSANNTDCNDYDFASNPDAFEYCDYYDNNCDGVVNEGLEVVVGFGDYDNDGFGDPNNPTTFCQGDSTFAYVATNNLDCNDYNYSSNPNGIEICDGYDNNCDGTVDEGFDPTTYYYDFDGDGFGGAFYPTVSCTPLFGYTENGDDCQDYSPYVFPGALEVCDSYDNDCDGQIDEGFNPTAYYYDYDGDGFGGAWDVIYSCQPLQGYVTNDDDCGDYQANVNPDATEICDGADNDCDGFYDEGTNTVTGYYDFDNDGFGNNYYGTVTGCEGNFGIVSNDDDCDDYLEYVNPDATEICDGVDNNCNAVTDEGFAPSNFYYDNDQDGFGDPWYTVVSCNGQPLNTVTNNADCQDYNPNVNPDQTEVCDLVDNDCNGSIDEGFPTSTFYYDFDTDGFGNPFYPLVACTGSFELQYYTLVSDNTDCNDYDALSNPTAAEYCDGSDNNCDGTIDEGFNPVTYHYDFDADGFGSAFVALVSCSAIDSLYYGYNFTTDGSDCNDYDASINPDQVEICDANDNNCDGVLNEGFTFETYFNDYDLDGFGYDYYPTIVCEGQIAPTGFINVGGDCNDYDATVNPDGIEVCGDYADNDCDGIYNNTADAIQLLPDYDLDGFGGSEFSFFLCPEDSLLIQYNSYYTQTSGDCNDYNAAINPSVIEDETNGIDDNCDGTIDVNFATQIQALYMDEDGDGFGSSFAVAVMGRPIDHPNHATNNFDCHDDNTGIHPLGQEICNNHDDDCNGEIDNDITCEETFSAWTLYPNPVSDRLTVVLPNDATLVPTKMVDASGRIVMQGDLTPGNPGVNVEALQPGIYFLRLEHAGNTETLRVIKL